GSVSSWGSGQQPVLLVVLQDALVGSHRDCGGGGRRFLFLLEDLLHVLDPHQDDAADHNCVGAQGPDPQDLEAGALLAPPSHHWRRRRQLAVRNL
ncbi:uncharacterized protein LOC120640375, partial [Panicum virgatum]|uniref:uncharacterized protein LOC120640375 n=1 Tax=Panicum virgatum TaxID=38727 RepID=UPI0019D655DD